MRIILTGGRWAHCAAADCVSAPIPCGAYIHATNAHAPPPGETGASPYAYIPSSISTTHHLPATPGPTPPQAPHHPQAPSPHQPHETAPVGLLSTTYDHLPPLDPLRPFQPENHFQSHGSHPLWPF